jgi:hypothetical protein
MTIQQKHDLHNLRMRLAELRGFEKYISRCGQLELSPAAKAKWVRALQAHRELVRMLEDLVWE